jgi:hypothetical protein
MASELLIRPAHNDHRMIEDLLAPSSGPILAPSHRPLISRLVIDSHIAAEHSEFASAAQEAGVPVLVDPLTPFWQGQLRTEDRWGKLSFGETGRLLASDFASADRRRQAIEAVVEFEVESGATAVIPPYPYIQSPDDAWFARALQFVRETARYMKKAGVSLPIAPVLCGSGRALGQPNSWAFGLDQFARAAVDVGPQFIGLAVSPVKSSDSVAKVSKMFDTYRHLKEVSGTRVVALRQGFFGPGLVAAGLDGYETGVGISEFCDIRSSINRRAPRKDDSKKSKGGAAGVYLEPIGRSVPKNIAEALFSHPGMKPKVACMDRSCCPGGSATTLRRNREHAIRTRAQALAILDSMPHTSWRLHQVAKDAQSAATLTAQVNGVLRAAKAGQLLNEQGLASLAQVTEHLRVQELGMDAA